MSAKYMDRLRSLYITLRDREAQKDLKNRIIVISKLEEKAVLRDWMTIVPREI